MIEFLKQFFGDEALTFDQLNEKLSADDSIQIVNVADGSYVPKEDYDKVNEQLQAATEEAKKYADFDSQLQAAKDEGEQKLSAYKREVAITKALTDANVADEVSVRANLKLDDIQLGEDGSITGMEDQLNALKESKPFLFTDPQQQLDLGGSTPGSNQPGTPKGIEGAVNDYYNN